MPSVELVHNHAHRRAKQECIKTDNARSVNRDGPLTATAVQVNRALFHR